jgi:plasmid stabilization system protein ParE
MTKYDILWSPLAKITYYQILEYLSENWTKKEIKAFVNRTEEVLKFISQSPSYYPFSALNDSYRCVVVKQVSLYYRLKNGQVELLIFWDNRQDPQKLLSLIK